jgi:hypothetical protein
MVEVFLTRLMLYNAFKPGRSRRKYVFLLAPKRCKRISRTSLFLKLQMMNIEVNLLQE